MDASSLELFLRDRIGPILDLNCRFEWREEGRVDLIATQPKARNLMGLRAEVEETAEQITITFFLLYKEEPEPRGSESLRVDDFIFVKLATWDEFPSKENGLYSAIEKALNRYSGT